MSAEEIAIRECRQEDLAGVSEVCCRTGYGGDDIARSKHFQDRTLFAMLFSQYYVYYERSTCFVAVPAGEPSRVIGYILGCPDTERYERGFGRRMGPRIGLRTFCFTLWRYPATVFELIRWGTGIPWREANPAGERYPAHLHIDILPDYQRQGIGHRLMETLEWRLRTLGVRGVHLVTSNHHTASLAFYAKQGYRMVRERRHRMWSGLDDYRSIVYTKRLDP